MKAQVRPEGSEANRGRPITADASANHSRLPAKAGHGMSENSGAQLFKKMGPLLHGHLLPGPIVPFAQGIISKTIL